MGVTLDDDTQNVIINLKERVQDLVVELDRLRNQIQELEIRVNRIDQRSTQLRQRV